MNQMLEESNWAHEENPMGHHQSKKGDNNAEDIEKEALSQGLWERRFLGALDCIEHAAILVNSTGTILCANALVTDLLGYSLVEIVGRELKDLTRDGSELVSQIVRRECPDDSMNHRGGTIKISLGHKDDRLIAVEISIMSVEASGDLDSVICILHAIKQAEPRESLEQGVVWQQTLKQNEARYRSIFENAVLGIYRTSPEGRILAANSSLLQMLGFTDLDELTTRNLEKEGFEPEYPRSEFRERIETDGEVIGLESAWRRRDGSTLWVRENAKAIRDETGEVLFYEGTVEDVTEQKKVEMALFESEQRLQATILAANLGIWEWDMRTQDVKIGGLHEQLLGFRLGEFDGRAESFYNRVHPDDLHVLNETTAKAIEDRIDCCTEFRVIWPDGSVHWLAGRGRFERDKNNQPIRMLGAFQDITEQKRAAEALQLSEERFRVFMEHLPAAAFIKDCHKNELYANRSALEVLSQSGENQLPLVVMNQLEKHDDQVLSENRVVGPKDICWNRDGQEFWLRDVRFPIATPKEEHLIGGFAWDITQNKHIEEALRESEERFRALVENLADGVFAHDLEGRFVMVNKAACDNTGYSREELLSMTVVDLDPESIERGDRKKLWLTMKLGQTMQTEVVQRRKDGHFYPVEIHLTCLILQGQPTILGVARDITERKRAVEAIINSEKKYRKLFNLSPESIVLLDTNGVILDVNPRFTEWMESRRDAFVDKVAFDLPNIPDYMRTQLIEAFERRKQGRMVEPHEVPFITASGAPRVGRILGTPVLDDSGTFLYILLMIQDITERKQAEEALRESETRFRELFHNMTSGVAIYEVVDRGQDFVFKDCNRATEEAVRLNHLEIIGKRLGHVFPGMERAGLLEAFRRVWQSGVPEHVPETLYKDDRQSFWVENHIYKLPCGEIVAIWDNVTSRKEVEQSLVQYQDKLKALTTELSLAEERERRRIGMGLHDHVGQSLVMTKFSLQALSMKTDALTTESLKGICAQIDELMDEIRSLSFELSDSVLYEVGFREAVEAYLVREMQRKHGLTCKLESEGDFSRLDDDMKIVLFRNLRELLTNVIKHAKAKKVWVRLRMAKAKVVVEVEDDGMGFEPEASDAVSVGRQAHFGLFSVREQLGCFGGYLEVQSKLDQGARVTMTVALL